MTFIDDKAKITIRRTGKDSFAVYLDGEIKEYVGDALIRVHDSLTLDLPLVFREWGEDNWPCNIKVERG